MEKYSKPLFVFLIVVLFCFWRSNSNLKNELKETKDELSNYEDALYQVNSNLEEARWYAWESYEEMGDALDNLETVQP